MNYEELLWERLYKAFIDCLKHKKNKNSTLEFYDARLTSKLFEIYQELLNFNYNPKKSRRYIISDPAWREIYAADFFDRIIHHFFMNEINDCLEGILIDNCCSCRKGKGTAYALKLFKERMMALSNNYQNDVYCLKIDLSGYFMKINRAELNKKFKALINNYYKGEFRQLLLYLCDFIVLDNPAKDCIDCFNPALLKFVPERRILNPNSINGMAIGNLPAQAGSNLNLNGLDHYIISIFPDYVRYVDDIVILSNDKNKLKNYYNIIIRKLQEYGQLINIKKTNIINCKYGVKFLEKITYPSGIQKPSKQYCSRMMTHTEKVIKEPTDYELRITSQIGTIINYNGRKLIQNYADTLQNGGIQTNGILKRFKFSNVRTGTY